MSLKRHNQHSSNTLISDGSLINYFLSIETPKKSEDAQGDRPDPYSVDQIDADEVKISITNNREGSAGSEQDQMEFDDQDLQHDTSLEVKTGPFVRCF